MRHRIGDERLLRLVESMLKAGILEDGLVEPETRYGHRFQSVLRKEFYDRARGPGMI